MSETLGMPITTVVMVSGYNLLAAGCIGPFVSAFSRKYGKRPVFLVSTILDIIGTAIGESKISYNYLLAARIVQGFSTSAFESLIVATVGDLYFVHQRGVRISFINFVLNSASSLASIICGVVFAHLGWLWLFRKHLLHGNSNFTLSDSTRSFPNIPRHPICSHVSLLPRNNLRPRPPLRHRRSNRRKTGRTCQSRGQLPTS